MKRRLSLIGIVFAALALTALSVLAGGWATVSLDELPPEIHAGAPQQFHFRVWQHGQTPVHFLSPNTPVEPLLIATNPTTAQRLEARATPDEEVGRFTVEVTFPSEGEWQWQILPNPLMLEGELPPLTVLAPVAPAPGGAAQGAEPRLVDPALWASIAALVVLAGGAALWAGRRAESSAVPVAKK